MKLKIAANAPIKINAFIIFPFFFKFVLHVRRKNPLKTTKKRTFIFGGQLKELSINEKELFGLNQKTDWAEAVVATNHGTLGIFHPAIIEIAATLGQRFHKLAHRLPSFVAKAIWLGTIDTNPALTLADIASVLDRILIKGL